MRFKIEFPSFLLCTNFILRKNIISSSEIALESLSKWSDQEHFTNYKFFFGESMEWMSVAILGKYLQSLSNKSVTILYWTAKRLKKSWNTSKLISWKILIALRPWDPSDFSASKRTSRRIKYCCQPFISFLNGRGQNKTRIPKHSAANKIGDKKAFRFKASLPRD